MASFTVDAARNGAPAAALPHARPVTRSRTAMPVRPALVRAKASAAGPRTARSSGPPAGVAAVPGGVAAARVEGGGVAGAGPGASAGPQPASSAATTSVPPSQRTRPACQPPAGPRAPTRTVWRVGTPFVPGRELSRRFYTDAVRPLLDERFGDLPHAAALVGDGSDVLGRDTPMSTDHGWGPAVTLFLPEAAAGRAPAIRALLTERLPRCFLGFPTRFADHPTDPGTVLMAPGGTETRVQTTTVRAFARRQLGWDPTAPLEPADWLSMASQQLLSVTAGPVFHDGPGELTALRERLAWYPVDVWRYLLAAGWARLGQEEHLMGRAGYAGDELGSAVIGARLVRDLMALAFLQERRYAPYPKWFGTAFAELPGGPVLAPLLQDVLRAETWPERQDAYAGAAEELLRRQNELALADPVPERASLFWGRPFWVVWGDRVAAALVDRITDPAVRRLTARRLVGGVDQWSDNTDLKAPEWRPVLRRVYD